MSERRCGQTVNRFGVLMTEPCGGDKWHGGGPFEPGDCRVDKSTGPCSHHEPLYAEPVADTTAEVTREQCVQPGCTFLLAAGGRKVMHTLPGYDAPIRCLPSFPLRAGKTNRERRGEWIAHSKALRKHSKGACRCASGGGK